MQSVRAVLLGAMLLMIFARSEYAPVDNGSMWSTLPAQQTSGGFAFMMPVDGQTNETFRFLLASNRDGGPGAVSAVGGLGAFYHAAT